MSAPVNEAAFAAQTAAWSAGALIRSRFGGRHDVRTKSSRIDLVTAVDRAAEERIVKILLAHTPGYGILAEESGHRDGDRDARWIIDPLDGTTNFAHGIPHFAVSIALEVEGVVRLGVVHDPIRGETFSALSGQGTRLNGARIKVSNVAELGDALLATGFGPDRRERPEYYLRPFGRVLPECQCIRRAGSAALDLCYVAAGRLDGFWEANLQAWDTAAGRLFVEEAGGLVTSFDGGSHDLFGPETCATNGLVHASLTALLAGGTAPS